MADHLKAPLTPAEHRAYHLVRVRQTVRELAVDLELARQDGAGSEELAAELRISVGALEDLERAWNG